MSNKETSSVTNIYFKNRDPRGVTGEATTFRQHAEDVFDQVVRDKVGRTLSSLEVLNLAHKDAWAVIEPRAFISKKWISKGGLEQNQLYEAVLCSDPYDVASIASSGSYVKHPPPETPWEFPDHRKLFYKQLLHATVCRMVYYAESEGWFRESFDKSLYKKR